MRIFKFAFWLSAVVIFLPASNDNNEELNANASAGALRDAGTMAMSVVTKAGNLADFCARQPEFCTAGAAALKAASSTELPITNASAADKKEVNARPSRSVQTVPRMIAGNGGKAKRNTLKLEDLIPDWKAPAGSTRS